ncbi:MAG: hypothetical protein ABFD08_08450 [Syntrophomonas sp.]
MYIPLIAGKPLNLWLGIVLIFLVAFQVLTGKRWIPVPFVYHRANGWIIAVVGLVHAFLGLGIWLLGFKIGP